MLAKKTAEMDMLPMKLDMLQLALQLALESLHSMLVLTPQEA